MNSPRAPFLSGLPARVVNLCRLRGGPQDLPYSPNLLALLVVAGTALDALTGGLLGEVGTTLARSLLSTGVVLALCWLALAIRNLRSRFVQTATALVACSIVFSLLQLPLALLAGPPPVNAGALTGLQLLLGWITIALFVWQLSVDAHIMRHAMEAPYALAFALVASWVLAYWAFDRLLLGAG
ncbi:hypothetical protein [Dokdonella soli]|uniref:Yip1 domain-containing protein n=1 Tax=Dokdonella soli TaxID=529810 RepID=A0ABP3TV92_9GAMM